MAKQGPFWRQVASASWLLLVQVLVSASVPAWAEPPALYAWPNDPTPIGDRAPLILVHGVQKDCFAGYEKIWDSFLWEEWAVNDELRQQTKPYLFRYETVLGLVEPGDPEHIDEVAAALRDELEARIALGEFEDKSFLILAHSMGGLVARSMMQEMRFADGSFGGSKVARLVTLATPHHGSPLANIYWWIPDLLCRTPENGFRLGLEWDGFFGGASLGSCNAWLSTLNVSGGFLNFPGSCAACVTCGGDGWFDKIIAYGATTTLDDEDYGDEAQKLAQFGFPSSDGAVPISSALFSGADIAARREVLFPCNHSEIWDGSCFASDDGGPVPDPIFAVIARDLLAALVEEPTPTITNVSPPVLEALQLPQTQHLAISGTSFSPNARLDFFDGQTQYPDRMPIQPVQPDQVEYDIAVGPFAAEWTVKVVNGTKASNAFPFWVSEAPGDDTTPPGPPSNVQLSPPSWGNPTLFYLDWTNPSDSTGITKVWWRWDNPPTFPGNGIAFDLPLFKPMPVNPVDEGPRTMYFWLEDGAGNVNHENWASVTVFRDATPPTVTITEDLGVPLAVNGYTVVLHGAAADTPSGVKTVQWLNNRGGAGGASGTTAWATSIIALSPGENVIRVSVSDEAGNQQAASLTVVSNSPPPVCGPWERVPGPVNSLLGAVYGDGQFVAVGDGVILRSDDGLGWQQAVVAGVWRDVVWTGAEYLAVGDAGQVARSPNGIAWTVEAALASSVNLNAVAWNGMQLVGVGRRTIGSSSYPSIWSSSDGSTWVLRATGQYGAVQDVIWNGTQFVTVGDTLLSPTRYRAWVSLDGVVWTSHEIPKSNGQEPASVAWGAGRYVAVGGQGTSVYTSPDAQTWTVVSNAVPYGSLIGVQWAGMQFVAVGSSSQILTSPDGLTWTVGNTGTSETLYDVAWSGEQLVAVGQDGSIWRSGCAAPSAWFRFSPVAPLVGQPVSFFDASTTAPTSWSWQFGDGGSSAQSNPTHTYSAAGVYAVSLTATNAHGSDSTTQQITVSLSPPTCGPWERVSGPVGPLLQGAVYGAGQFVAVSDSVILRSNDGLTWQQVAVPGSWTDVVWTGAEYLVVGLAGQVARSPDGVEWTVEAALASSVNLNAVAWNGEQFVGVGQTGTPYSDPGIWSSLNGSNWVLRVTGQYGSVQDVTWSGTQFVTAGDSFLSPTRYLAWVSPDGVAWTSHEITRTGVVPRSVAWGGGRYVAVGGQGTSVYTSPDAQTWTAAPNAVPYGSLIGVQWAGMQFVAVGSSSQILTSPDGLTWTVGNTGTSETLYDVAWSGEQLVAVGQNGSIWRSGCDGRALTVYLSGPGSGTVTSNPAGISCGADCSELFYLAEAVSLLPAAAPHSSFSHWGGDSDCSDGAVTMTTARSCDAFFDLDSYGLTVTKVGSGNGSVTSSPPGIACGSDCAEPFTYGTLVTLVPSAGGGSYFVGWTGDPDCADGSILVDGAAACTADFGLLGAMILVDGFEFGNTSAWSAVSP